MKFGKEFALQMVPEWKEAYMGYEKLKTLVAEIQRFKQRNTQPPMTQKRKQSLYRAFSGLISHKHSRPTSPSTPGKDTENQVILMNSIKRDDDSESYETMFLMAADEGGDLELLYFRRLDEEFNKVVQFYKSKVDEVMKEAVALNKQMDALIALRIKVEDPEKWLQNSASTSSFSASRARSSSKFFLITQDGNGPASYQPKPFKT